MRGFSIKYIVFYTIIILFIAACATVVKPSGGSADRIAPVRLDAFPADSSINFTENKIILIFDEFVKLNSPRTQILMNPYIDGGIEVNNKGKKIIVHLPDSLKKNSTYHIFFGNSVQDITEGNIASNLHYVFSTGSFLDSCSITGYAINAFENTSNPDAWLMLHKEINDIKDTTPVYLTHANEKGAFVFSNLSPGKYHVLALVDANSDYRFNLPNEKIGFFHETIELTPNKTRVDSIKIRLFQDIDSTQKKIKNEVIRYRTVRISFKSTLENPQVKILKGGDAIYEWSSNKDTVIFWVPDLKQDSLSCIIQDGEFIDTIHQSLNVKIRFNKAITDTVIKIHNNLRKNKLLHFDTLKLSFSAPILKKDHSKIMLISDSTSIDFEIIQDDSLAKSWAIIFENTLGAEAQIIIDKDAFTNIFGHSNDSLAFKFKTTTEDDFGMFILTLGLAPSSPFLVQISSSEMYREQYLAAHIDSIIFKNLLPGEYQVKLIVDKNKDKKYTSGDFDSQRQAEPVYTLPRPINIRKNWESRNYWLL